MKRPRDVFDTPSSSSPPEPSSKRRYISAMVQSSPTTGSALHSTPYTLPRHISFRSPWAEATPHDSPSNPFGLNRALRALTLPRPSGFGKHVVLRMQIVSQIDSRARSRRIAAEAPYRVVQVPLNYSVRLLHMLILFLFASDAHLRVRRRKRVFSPSVHPRQPPPPVRKPKADLDVFGESPKGREEGHLFEAYEDVSVYANTYRPGIIKPGSGKLYARLSSARERKLFPGALYEDEDEDEDEDVFGNAQVKRHSNAPPAEVRSEDEEGWDWEAEDDFVLSNVWTDGPDLKKGIIYHHTPSTTIHITANQTRVPPRKGTGNTPHVFAARGGTNGAVRITNVFSRPVFVEDEGKENINLKSAVARKAKSRRTGGKAGKDRAEELLEEDLLEVDDLDDSEDASEDQLNRWNDHDAFQRFLKQEAARERAMRQRSEPKAKSPTPITFSPTSIPKQSTHANVFLPASSPLPSRPNARGSQHYYYAQPSASSSTTSLTPSSPSTLPVPLASSDFDGDWSDGDLPDLGVDEEDDDDKTYRIELPLQTPFPAHPAVRRRVARVCKRLERQTSKGLSEMESDEDEVDSDGKGTEGKGKGKGKGNANKADTKKEERDTKGSKDTKSKGKEGVAEQAKEKKKNGQDITARPKPAVQVHARVDPPVVAVDGPVFEFGRIRMGGREELGDEEDEKEEVDSEDEGWDPPGPEYNVEPLAPVVWDWDSDEEV